MFNLRRFCIGAALGLSLLACAPAYGQANVLHNGSFEGHTGGSKITGWNVSSGANLVYSTMTSVKAHQGHGFALLTTSGKVSQTLATNLVSGATYRLSGYFRVVSNLPHVTFGIQKSVVAGVNHNLSFKSTGTTARGYQLLTATFKAPTPTAKFQEHAVFIGSSGQVAMDDVRITRVTSSAPEVDPEAGAPALALALGGLALMTERRQREESEQ